MTNEEAISVLKDLKRDAEGKLMGDDFDDVFQNNIQALDIAIDAIELNGVDRLDNAVESVLDDYLSKELAEKIKNEITLELARSFDTKLS